MWNDQRLIGDEAPWPTVQTQTMGRAASADLFVGGLEPVGRRRPGVPPSPGASGGMGVGGRAVRSSHQFPRWGPSSSHSGLRARGGGPCGGVGEQTEAPHRRRRLAPVLSPEFARFKSADFRPRGYAASLRGINESVDRRGSQQSGDGSELPRGGVAHPRAHAPRHPTRLNLPC